MGQSRDELSPFRDAWGLSYKTRVGAGLIWRLHYSHVWYQG